MQLDWAQPGRHLHKDIIGVSLAPPYETEAIAVVDDHVECETDPNRIKFFFFHQVMFEFLGTYVGQRNGRDELHHLEEREI